LAYQAALASNDTLTQLTMLKAPDREHFIAAQILELESLVANGVFAFHETVALPPSARLLNAIWSHKRKRSPTGEFQRQKSNICSSGS
jgi:hypothetical protein